METYMTEMSNALFIVPITRETHLIILKHAHAFVIHCVRTGHLRTSDFTDRALENVARGQESELYFIRKEHDEIYILHPFFLVQYSIF
jgi:hypothetical protein